MTPSNPSNSQPLIYRIMDALGVTHLVACINHTHEQSEVDGLQAALLNKADASSTDTKINGKISRVPTATNGNLAEFDDDGNIKDSGKKTSDFADASTTAAALAGKQDTLIFDTIPTTNSTNPVTSGGVKAYVDNKRNIRQEDSETGDLAQVVASAEEGDVYVSIAVREGDEMTKTANVTFDNIANLQRALTDPDSTPTESSDNLVTSGGVAEAIKDATKVLFVTNVPFDTSTLEKGILYTTIIKNTLGETKPIGEMLDQTNLPIAERNIFWNVATAGIEVGNDDEFGVRLVRKNNGVYAFYDGMFVY